MRSYVDTWYSLRRVARLGRGNRGGHAKFVRIRDLRVPIPYVTSWISGGTGIEICTRKIVVADFGLRVMRPRALYRPGPYYQVSKPLNDPRNYRKC